MFSETIFPYAPDARNNLQTDAAGITELWAPISEGFQLDEIIPKGPCSTRPIPFEIGSTSQQQVEMSETQLTTDLLEEESPINPNHDEDNYIPPAKIPTTATRIVDESNLGKGKRHKSESVRLKDFVVSQPSRKNKKEVSNMVSTNTTVLYPIEAQDDFHRFHKRM